MNKDYVFMSESVTGGHPDKLCDRISDAIVDRFLYLDPSARINAECAVATGTVFIAAAFDASEDVDIPEIARRVIDDTGYRDEDFSARDCAILTSFAAGAGERPGAPGVSPPADDPNAIKPQEAVTAFGFACDQTAVHLPLPIYLAHRLARRMDEVRPELDHLSPDAKTQVGVTYREGRPQAIQSVSLRAFRSRAGAADHATLADRIREHVIEAVFRAEGIRPDAGTAVMIDIAGSVGGPADHAGLTGRKTAIDTYGEFSRHSGAALSGKDIHRIDRIGAYAARYAAKNIVAAGLAGQCEVALSYTAGLPGPVSILVETARTGRVDDGELKRRVERVFDFRPAAIMRDLGLEGVVRAAEGRFFQHLAAYGHMGRADLSPPWERTDRVEALLD